MTGAAVRSAVAGFVALWTAAAAPCLAVELMTFQDVRAGMRGVGRTVFRGVQVEEFQVEILGRLENVGPDQDIILARLTGGPLATTGVMQGMSGSPIYIDGKLIGAAAYSWAFAREAIAGITPIHEMLRMLERDRQPGVRAAAPMTPSELGRRALFPETLREAAESWGARLRHAASHTGFATSPLPLLLSRLSPAATQELMRLSGAPPVLAGLPALQPGVMPIQSGAQGRAAPSPAASELAPGSPVGARLIGGDLEVTAIGTVTHRDGDQILAFGHPLFNAGPSSVPMTSASVEALLPSLASSFKIASGGAVVGAILQDRLTGIYGKLGAKPRTLPVRVEISSDGPRSDSFTLEVAEDPLLTPLLLHVAILSLLSREGRDLGEVTVEIKRGSVIQVEGSDGIQLSNLYSGHQSSFLASLTVAYLVYIVMNNEYRPAPVGAVNLMLEVTPGRRASRLGRVWTSRPSVPPGGKLDVFVEVLPLRERPRVEKVTLEIPEEASEGRAFLQVGDALALARAEGEGVGAMPRDLDQLIWLINHLRSNDRAYVTLAQADNGVWAEGERLPNLPPTQSILIAPPQRGSDFLNIPLRGLAEESIRVSGALQGHRLLYLEIRR